MANKLGQGNTHDFMELGHLSDSLQRGLELSNLSQSLSQNLNEQRLPTQATGGGNIVNSGSNSGE